MSSTKFTILKQCLNCGNMFEAQRTSTKYCSHKCNQQHYKLRKRLEKKAKTEKVLKQQLTQPQRIKPKVKAVNLALIKDKDFLSVSEVAVLLSCSKHTVYKLINKGRIKATNIGEKLTRIKRTDLDKLFMVEKPTQSKKELTISDCYTMTAIIDKYKVSRNTIYNYVRKHNIERIKESGITYYSKIDIDRIFKV